MYGRVEEVAENVFAYIQGRGEWFVNNTGLIVGDSYAILVDTVSSEERALKMLDAFKEVTDKPIKVLVNTHGHPDHVWTNHLVNAISIAHENARRETAGAVVEIYKPLFPQLDFRGARVTLQDVTFERRLRLHPGFEVELTHPGVAHTSGDSYVYLPQKKVVFCGDLLFAKPCTPFALGGSIRGYIAAMRELLNLDAEVYVPGHGGVVGKEGLEAAIGYLEFVWEEAKKRHERGIGWYEAAMDIDLGEYSKWNESERIVGNVARAYAEIEGREMEFAEIVEAARKMLEYGGGRK